MRNLVLIVFITAISTILLGQRIKFEAEKGYFSEKEYYEGERTRNFYNLRITRDRSWLKDTIYMTPEVIDNLMEELVGRYTTGDSSEMMCLERYEVEFVSLIRSLIGSNIEMRPNPNTISYAGYFVYDVTKGAMDSFYEDYKKCRDNITPEIIKEFFKLTVYQHYGHSYEHPWHLLTVEKEFWEDLCPTYDSIDYELKKLQNQVLGRETIAERPMGYSLLSDTCRTDSFKIYWLNKSIEYYRQAHLTYTEEQIQAGIQSIRLAIDSLSNKSKE